MKTKGKSTIVFILCVAFITLLGYIGAAGIVIGDYEALSFGQTIKRGLDLQGGITILQEVAGDEKVTDDVIERTRDLLALRVNRLGVAETSVVIEGSRRIRIDIPGATDSAGIVESLTKTGELTFRDPDDNVLLKGEHVTKATVGFDEFNRPIIYLELNDEGTKIFADATAKFIGQRIAIYMDDDQLTNPTVQTAITGGKAQITGSRTLEEAKQTAGIIQSGALPVALKTASVRMVGPTLGENAVPDSLKAGLVGLAIVFLFMILYYRVPGMLANLALTLYILLVLYTFVGIGAALTLPGIAGLLLTIGMAVDANVLIFERIKEELKLGKSVRAAVDSGFNRALSSILDANITTVIAGLVLYTFGSGAVKGFALTLLIGIILSMISAIVVTKFFVKLALNMGILKSAAYFGVKTGGSANA
jgi:preprotein translocase subunit SecD